MTYPVPTPRSPPSPEQALADTLPETSSAFLFTLTAELESLKARLWELYRQSVGPHLGESAAQPVHRQASDSEATATNGEMGRLDLQALCLDTRRMSIQEKEMRESIDTQAVFVNLGPSLSAVSFFEDAEDIAEMSTPLEVEYSMKANQSEGRHRSGVCALASLAHEQRLVRKHWCIENVWEATGRPLDDLKAVWDSETARMLQELNPMNENAISRRLSRLSHSSSFGLLEGLAGGFERKKMHMRCSLPLNPDSEVRVTWDLACLLFLIYDAIITPLVLFVLPAGGFSEGVDLTVCCFWLLDIAMTLVTSVFVNSELIMDFRVIAREYLKGWLLPDLLIVLPDLFLQVAAGDRGGFALLRIMRCVRLLRVLKMEGRLVKHLQRINSSVVLSIMHLLQLVFCFLMLNHIIACLWFYIGQSDSNGWLYMVGLSEAGASEGYLVALHWSIANFHGSMDVVARTVTERTFAVLALVIGMLTFSMFMTAVMGMVVHMKKAHKKQAEYTQKLRQYFLHYKISVGLMLSVKRYLEDNRVWQQDEEGDNKKLLLRPLPMQLQKHLMAEIHSPAVQEHCIFSWLQRRHVTAFRDITHGVFGVMEVQSRHGIFDFGDACHCMLFLESGHCRYVRGQHTSDWVDPGSREMKQIVGQRGILVGMKSAICELALWIRGWQNKGSLFSITHCSLLNIETSSLAAVVSHFPTVHFDMSLYARCVLQKIELQDSEDFSDLWTFDL